MLIVLCLFSVLSVLGVLDVPSVLDVLSRNVLDVFIVMGLRNSNLDVFQRCAGCVECAGCDSG